MRRALSITTLFAVALTFVADGVAQDDGVTIEISRTGARKVRVGLRPLEVESSHPDALGAAQTLASRFVQDAVFSDVLAVTEPVPGGVTLPRHPNLSEEEQDLAPDAWIVLRLEGDAETGMSWTGELYDPQGETLIVGKRYRIDLDKYKQAVHHFADEVVHHLTGEVGIAQTRVIFSRGDGKRRELYLVDYDGEGMRQITRNGSINLAPRWSPDDNRVCYTSYHRGRQRLLILDGRTGKSRRIADFEGLNVGASWSPDGKELAVTLSRDGNAEVYRISPEGEILQRLTFDPSIECSPSFDPGGQQIAFTSDRTGVPQIYVMDREGANRRRISYEGRYNESARWSPRGERIAYVSRIEGRFQVFTVEPDGSDVQQITFSQDGSNEDPAWAPDGRHLVVSSDRGGSRDLWIVDVESGASRRLTRGEGEDTGPAWSGAPTRSRPGDDSGSSKGTVNDELPE